MQVLSVNVGRAEPNPYKSADSTGIGKRPTDERVPVRAPGPKHGGLGSGLVGDFIGDQENHGGDEQAVYAFQAEDLARWTQRLGRPVPAGAFGENLTTHGIDLADALIGEVWQVGDDGLELVVTCPRIPCATFRGVMGEKGWLKTFTADARPGAYLGVRRPGTVGVGDPIRVVHRPDHGVTIERSFRALTLDRSLQRDIVTDGEDMEAALRRLSAA